MSGRTLGFSPRVSAVKSNDRPINRPVGLKQLCGEKCANAILTEELVRRIRLLHVPGFGSGKIAKVLAAEGIIVNPRTIDGVLNGLNWRHVK